MVQNRKKVLLGIFIALAVLAAAYLVCYALFLKQWTLRTYILTWANLRTFGAVPLLYVCLAALAAIGVRRGGCRKPGRVFCAVSVTLCVGFPVVFWLGLLLNVPPVTQWLTTLEYYVPEFFPTIFLPIGFLLGLCLWPHETKSPKAP